MICYESVVKNVMNIALFFTIPFFFFFFLIMVGSIMIFYFILANKKLKPQQL